ncbi:MAG: class I SAM-dependent methyltransferase [Microlunatus sp.]
MENAPGPRLGDAFGELLVAQSRDLTTPQYELVERDDGFLGVTDARIYFRDVAGWGPLEWQACEQAQGRVLDVGCGAGRHSIAMIARGLEVTGLEPSPGAAQIARSRGVSVVQRRLDQLAETDGTFDTIVMLGNNLSLLASPETATATLTNLAAHAAPGAILLGQAMDPYGTKDPLHLAYHEWNRARGRPGGQLRIRVRFRGTVTDWFDYWFLTVDELAAAVESTPWALSHVEHSGPAYLATLTRLPAIAS